MAPRPRIDEPFVIRPIRPDDHARLRAYHERLTPETRYRRFLAAKPYLSGADARYLVDVDGRAHVALVVTLPDRPEAPIVAVARFVRAAEDPEVAEVAIVVADEFQHRGMGGELLAHLARSAVERGVRRFRATMLTDNLAVQRLFEQLAVGPMQRQRLGGLLEMEFALPGAAATGDALRAVPAVRALSAA